MEQFESLSVLNKLLVSFSRDKSEGEKGDRPRYVQDLMRQQGESLVSLITDKKALVYVCGDAKGMARGVTETFTGLLQTYRGECSGYMYVFLGFAYILQNIPYVFQVVLLSP